MYISYIKKKIHYFSHACTHARTHARMHACMHIYTQHTQNKLIENVCDNAIFILLFLVICTRIYTNSLGILAQTRFNCKNIWKEDIDNSNNTKLILLIITCILTCILCHS